VVKTVEIMIFFKNILEKIPNYSYNKEKVLHAGNE